MSRIRQRLFFFLCFIFFKLKMKLKFFFVHMFLEFRTFGQWERLEVNTLLTSTSDHGSNYVGFGKYGPCNHIGTSPMYVVFQAKSKVFEAISVLTVSEDSPFFMPNLPAFSHLMTMCGHVNINITWLLFLLFFSLFSFPFLVCVCVFYLGERGGGVCWLGHVGGYGFYEFYHGQRREMTMVNGYSIIVAEWMNGYSVIYWLRYLVALPRNHVLGWVFLTFLDFNSFGHQKISNLL